LNPPRRENIPLWLALLLKKQKRANIIPPPWLSIEVLSAVLHIETEQQIHTFSPGPDIPKAAGSSIRSPPFLPTSVVDSKSRVLPYHWLELGELLLDAASDDFENPDEARSLLRSLREARLAKLRAGVEALGGGGGIQMNGVGAMELAESRAFIGGVIDGLRFVTFRILLVTYANML
jgi:GINS complex subunit 2